jgi:hypothetical protein
LLARIKYLLDGRLYEWTFSGVTLWLAVEVFQEPSVISGGMFHRLLDYMSVDTIIAYSFVISTAGMGALVTNGYSKIVGPIIRSVCATGRAFLWSQFGYALHLSGGQDMRPTTTGFWVLFTLAELYVAYRAMADVQRAL